MPLRFSSIIQRIISDLIRNSFRRRPFIKLALSLLLAVIVYAFKAAPVQLPPDQAQIVYVIDGDTFIVRLNNSQEKVRLIGVDAPELHANEKALKESEETGQPVKEMTVEGKIAKEHLEKMIHPGTRIKLEYDTDKYDQYQRVLAYAYLENGTFINMRMVADGYAIHRPIRPNLKLANEFEAAYRTAQSKRLGLFRRYNFRVLKEKVRLNQIITG